MPPTATIVKAIIAFFTSLGTWGATAAADGKYDQVELWGLSGVIIVTLGVWAFPNAPTEPAEEVAP